MPEKEFDAARLRSGAAGGLCMGPVCEKEWKRVKAIADARANRAQNKILQRKMQALSPPLVPNGGEKGLQTATGPNSLPPRGTIEGVA